jgi:hypothetical protein
MIIHASHIIVGMKNEGGASRETPNRGSHSCHHLLFDACRSGLESVVVL